MTASKLHSANRPVAQVALGLSLALVLAHGCAAIDQATLEGGACGQDADCATGLICHEGRVCVTAQSSEATAVLRLIPPPSSGLVSEHFMASVGGDGHIQGGTWMLTEPAVLYGTVEKAGSVLSLIPGTLIASAPADLEGITLRYETQSSSAEKDFAGAGASCEPASPDGVDPIACLPHGFELRVQAGYLYDLHFWPDSDQLPPWYGQLTVSGSSDQPLKITLPGETELVTVRGRIVARPEALNACEVSVAPAEAPCAAPACEPVVGLRVALKDGAGQRRSSLAVTDGDGGFEVVVDPTALTVWLRAKPASPLSSLPYLRLARAIDIASASDSGEAVELGDISVGPAAAQVDTRAVVSGANDAVVVGATVRFDLDLPMPTDCVDGVALPRFNELYVAAEGHTDKDGHFSASLPAGPALLTVSPMDHTADGSWQDTVTVDAGDVAVVCPLRRRLEGRVLGFGEQAAPVAGAKVLLRGAPGDEATYPDGRQVPKAGGQHIVATDHEGRFSAWVDPGRYALIVEPPTGAGQPRAVVATVDVSVDADLLGLELSMPAPVLFVGSVLAGPGKPIEGVLVDLLSQDPGKAAPLHENGVSAQDSASLVFDTQLLGSTMTDAAGRFEVLVAAPGSP